MIFITGGTGLLGMRIVYDILIEGIPVRLLRRNESNLELFSSVLDFYHGADSTELRSNIEWLQGDLLDPVLLEEAMHNCDYCIHAAAMVSFHPKDRETMRKVNIEGTANIVNACLAVGDIKLLYISSVAALGRVGNTGTIDESHLWKDSPYNSGYAISKYHAEMEVWRGIEEGLDAVMVNPSIILGAGDPGKSSGTIFGAVLNGLRFYTDGGASVVDARDVSRMSLKLMKSSVRSERYVLNSKSLPYKGLFEMIAESLDKPKPTIHASNYLLSIAWRLAALKDFIFGGRSPITQETALSAKSSYVYESKKVKEELGDDFHDLGVSVTYYGSYYSRLS
jgi:nucleoside-diphosphate-sugar epimerase